MSDWDAPDVAEQLLHRAGVARRGQDEQDPAPELERIEHPGRGLGLPRVEREILHERELRARQRVRERRTQCTPLHLLVDAHLVIARPGAVHHAAARPLRGTVRALASTAAARLAAARWTDTR